MKSALILYLLSLALVLHTSNAVECVDEAWFVMVPVEKSILRDTLLPQDFCLQENHTLKDVIPDGFHPVLFEFGRQRDCYQPGIPFFKTGFNEFKMEVPFVQTTNGYGPNVYKPYIYVDSFSNAWNSFLFYGLPAFDSDIDFGTDTYIVKYKGGEIYAKFTPTSPEFFKKDNFPNFNNYITAVKTPWFCHNIITKNVKCAENHYNWDSMILRPVNGIVKITGDILGKGLNGKTYTFSNILSDSIGAVELRVPLSITFQKNCEYKTQSVCPQ